MEDLQEEGCPEGVGNLTEASHWTIHTEILGEEDPSAVVHQAEVSAAWAPADPLPGMTGTEEVIPLGRDALQTWIPEEEDPP